MSTINPITLVMITEICPCGNILVYQYNCIRLEMNNKTMVFQSKRFLYVLCIMLYMLYFCCPYFCIIIIRYLDMPDILRQNGFYNTVKNKLKGELHFLHAEEFYLFYQNNINRGKLNMLL